MIAPRNASATPKKKPQHAPKKFPTASKGAYRPRLSRLRKNVPMTPPVRRLFPGINCFRLGKKPGVAQKVDLRNETTAAGVQQKSTVANGLQEFASLLLLPFLQFPFHGLDFPSRTPPFGASPHSQHSAAIGKPNAYCLVRYRLRIINYSCFGGHSIAIEVQGSHSLSRGSRMLRSPSRRAQGTIRLNLGPFTM
jgi:hypothetical protein